MKKVIFHSFLYVYQRVMRTFTKPRSSYRFEAPLGQPLTDGADRWHGAWHHTRAADGVVTDVVFLRRGALGRSKK